MFSRCGAEFSAASVWGSEMLWGLRRATRRGRVKMYATDKFSCEQYELLGGSKT